MQYRNDRHGDPVSLLGFGCMRLPKSGPRIDADKAEAVIMEAYNNGVNYFDTAYIYPDSEAVLGRIFEKNGIRDKIRIATKLPQYLVKSRQAIDKYFETELSRLRTDHVDYYLMHMINDVERWNQLVGMGIKDWIAEKKASGQIRNIGFSFHGNTDNFKLLVDAYDWDFCMIQYNYMDENTQAGRSGLQYAHAKGMPVIIMEPLRGGKLVDLLPQNAKRIFADDPRGRTPAEWGLRWLWEQPEVTCVLSGMNSLDMVHENIRVASDVRIGEFTDDDRALFDKVIAAIREGIQIGCTGCSYCMPCPHGVDIPIAFRCYNAIESDGYKKALHEYIQCTLFRRTPGSASRCVGCGACEKHCPQHLQIRKELKVVSGRFEHLYYHVAQKGIRFLNRW